ncbi:MAG: carboxylesterase family protein [Archangium sp.]
MRALLFVVLLSCTACIPRRINWREVNARSDHSTLRHTPVGDIIGFVEIDGTLSWVGIPYAKAPVRWKAPKPFGCVDPIMFSATKYGPECPQLDENGAFTGDENCLTLNISARSIDDAKKPVIVFVHDGSKATGTGNAWSVMRRVSSRYGVVMVAVNYRLGVLGTLKRPSISVTDDTPADASGNYGTLDVIEALKWVRSNIGPFGGDPDNVTVFGSSEVFALLHSPLASGLFQRAAINDGVPASVNVEEASAIVEAQVLELLVADGRAPNREEAKGVFEKMGVAEIANYLRAHPVEQLATVLKGTQPPVRDGHVVKEERISKTPLMLGVSSCAANYERAFFREVGVDLPSDEQSFLYCFAGSDLASMVLGDENEDEPARVKQSRNLMSYWVQFATKGDPARGVEGNLPEWPSATSEHRFMQLDVPQPSQGRETLDAMLDRLWNDSEFKTDAARCEVAYRLFEGVGGATGNWSRERAARIAARCQRGN